MKKKVMMAAAIVAAGLITTTNVSAQGQEKEKAVNEQSIKQEASFTVYGNCGMCKKTIERAASKLDGVESASWDANSNTLTVKYDSKAVEEIEIHEQIATAGYDTEKVKATDEAYNNLMGCCQYERPESKE